MEGKGEARKHLKNEAESGAENDWLVRNVLVRVRNDLAHSSKVGAVYASIMYQLCMIYATSKYLLSPALSPGMTKERVT